MPLTNYALDTYVSQNLSYLKVCEAPDLSNEFDQAEHWVNNFILNSMLSVQVKPEVKPFIFGILRRIQMALAEYGAGRSVLLEYLDGSKEKVSLYFRSLYHFEIAASLVYQSFDLVMKLTHQRLYQKNDGSPLARLNRIYNVSKHLETSTIPHGHIHAVWITNEGLAVSTAELTWEEIAELIKEAASLADSLSNPAVTAQNSDKNE